MALGRRRHRNLNGGLLRTEPPALPINQPGLGGGKPSPNVGKPQPLLPGPGSTPGLPLNMGIPSGEGPGGGFTPDPVSTIDSGTGAGPVSGEATVSGQLETLLKKDSPLYDIAEGDTIQRMNERGVANSSMALGEQELARTRVALDIAKSDASTFAASDLSKQKFGEATALSLQDFTQRSALLTQEWGSKFGFDMQQHTNRVDEINVALMADLEKIAKNGEVQQDIDSNRYTEVLGGQFLNSVTERQKAMSSEIEAIYQTEGLTTAQQNGAIAKALSRYEDDLVLLGGYYSQSPTWDNDWGAGISPDSGGTPSSPGPLPGTPTPPGSSGGPLPGTPTLPEPPPPASGSPGGGGRRPPGSWWSQEEGDWVTQ